MPIKPNKPKSKQPTRIEVIAQEPGRPLFGLTIRVQLRSSYGRERIYPVCETAAALLHLANAKTFSREQLKHLADSGVTIEWIPTCIELDAP